MSACCFSYLDRIHLPVFLGHFLVTFLPGLNVLWLLDISSDNNSASLYSLVLIELNLHEYHVEQKSADFFLKDLIIF